MDCVVAVYAYVTWGRVRVHHGAHLKCPLPGQIVCILLQCSGTFQLHVTILDK